jgi:hypothetical protein
MARRVKDAVLGMKNEFELLEQLNKELVPEDLTEQDQPRSGAAGDFASGSTTWQPLLKATLQQQQGGLRSHCHLSCFDLNKWHVGLLEQDRGLLQAERLASWWHQKHCWPEKSKVVFEVQTANREPNSGVRQMPAKWWKWHQELQWSEWGWKSRIKCLSVFWHLEESQGLLMPLICFNELQATRQGKLASLLARLLATGVAAAAQGQQHGGQSTASAAWLSLFLLQLGLSCNF